MINKEPLHLLVIPSNPQRTDYPSLEWLIENGFPCDIVWGHNDVAFRMRPIYPERMDNIEKRGPLCAVQTDL